MPRLLIDGACLSLGSLSTQREGRSPKILAIRTYPALRTYPVLPVQQAPRVKASTVGSFEEPMNAGLGNMTSNFSRRHVVRRQQVLVASKRPACNGDDRRQLVLF